MRCHKHRRYAATDCPRPPSRDQNNHSIARAAQERVSPSPQGGGKLKPCAATNTVVTPPQTVPAPGQALGCLLGSWCTTSTPTKSCLPPPCGEGLRVGGFTSPKFDPGSSPGMTMIKSGDVNSLNISVMHQSAGVPGSGPKQRHHHLCQSPPSP
ncbi:MAG: hypothetical protein ACJAZW_001630 [Maritalea sp.]